MITIEVQSMKATVSAGVWKSEDELLQAMLNASFTPRSLKGYHPDMDTALAEMAAGRLGATVVESESGEYVAGRIY